MLVDLIWNDCRHWTHYKNTAVWNWPGPWRPWGQWFPAVCTSDSLPGPVDWSGVGKGIDIF